MELGEIGVGCKVTDCFRILALDGGGFRGLVQAIILSEMEERSGTRCVDCFDLIAGTSTGGILALALSLGLPARDIVDFYIEDGPGIFGSSWFDRRFRKLLWWVSTKHPSKPLELALKRRFGDAILGSAITRVVVPAFDIGLRKPYIFKTDHAQVYQSDWRRPMWEIAMATTAAPTYFRTFESSWGTHYCDGGLWANNPSQVTLTEASAILGVPASQIELLNVGNGCTTVGAGTPSWTKRHGLLGWARDVPDLLMQGSDISVAQSCKVVLRSRFLRVEPVLTNEAFPLDEYNPGILKSHAIEAARWNAAAMHRFFDEKIEPYAKHRNLGSR